MIEKLKAGVRDLNPGYFALVMATGIVSIAASSQGMPLVAEALFALNNVFYVVLWSLTLARLALYPARLLADLAAHGTSPAFLTVVAATCVLGSQHVTVADNPRVATALWAAGIALWLLLIYAFFAAVTVSPKKPGIEAGLSGAWLLATVSTQSISVLGTLLAPRFGGEGGTVYFVSLTAFLLGCMLYLLVINLIVYRFSFFPLPPEALTPPYWINMGAVAITTLAGARLIRSAGAWPLLGEVRPFLVGFTLFFWATATWWIPLLVVLGVWRHVVKRHPVAYHPQYLSIVFPLGMYSASTYQLGRALDVPVLLIIPRYAVFVALAAWAVTTAAMAASLARGLRGGGTGS